MDAGGIIGFVICCIVGSFFVIIGISSFFSKKPVGFWANIKMREVTDTRNYNRATGKLFFCFGVALVILGLPLLAGQNSPLVLLSIAGDMFLVISVMLVYELVIMKKYHKK